MDLKGKRVLVTGASRRIGRATAIECGRRGARVGVHYRGRDTEAQTTAGLVEKAGGEAVTFGAELTEAGDVERLFVDIRSAFAGLDVLINNASVFVPDKIDDLTIEGWDRHLDTNARAPVLLAQAAARLMTPGPAKIINVADVAGDNIWPGYFSYSVSKAALLAATKGLAKALAPAILVNAVCPGPVLFPETYDDAQRGRAIERTLLKREGSPGDVVSAIMFLIENDYVTGESIHVDGGRHLV